jgi:uncharacterized membrane-anchored protein YitT (DUF2179 family)
MTGVEQEILYCVVTRLEIGRINAIVRDTDPGAFVAFHPLSNAYGGTMARRAYH